MAHQDYVSRSKSPKKKNNPYKKTAEASAQPLPAKVKLLSLILVVAIASFGYLLWSIKDIEPEQTLPPKAAQPSTKKSSDLPEPPKEKWSYMEELKSKEVEVGEYKVEETRPQKMQCGSFKTEQRAEVMKATIAFAGLSSQITRLEGKNGVWYRVYLGPYKTKRLAEKDKHKLKSNGITTCRIVPWN